jgi:DNA-binding NarL/FixJ family response regulator
MDDHAPVRVLLADQPGFGRSALAQLVAETPGVVLVASVADAGLIESALRDLRPDVVVVDDRLVGSGSWARRHAGTRVIVVGVDDDPGYAARAERLGADAWLAKDRADAALPALLSRLDPVGR